MCTVLYALTFGCWQDERERETAIHQRLEKKWLGNIKIPFSTIYLNGKVSLSFGHYEQHQKPFLRHLPQWKS